VQKRRLMWLLCVLSLLLANVASAQTTSGFTLTANPTSASTPAGQLVSFTITVTPGPGAAPNVAFTCTDPIPASGCSFNPTSVNTSNGPVTTSMSVATNFFSSGAKAEPSHAPLSHSNGVLYSMLSLGGAGLFGLVLPANRSGNKRKRLLGVAVVATAALAIIFSFEGCGGPRLRTTPGNYSVTVTAASQNFNPPQTATTAVSITVF